MQNSTQNVDNDEVAKFDALARKWWDKNSDLKTLHDINPLRLNYIQKQTELKNKTVLDVGCGGGILSESLAKQKANVTGIDLAEASIAVATLHAKESKLNIDYQRISAEEYAKQHPEEFDVITCMELLEHVPDPASTIEACAKLTKPGGTVFFSTLNRNATSYVQAILGAEYILRLLPKGTHEYAKFIRPSELRRFGTDANLELIDLTGLQYNPITRYYKLSNNVKVNYLATFKKQS